MKTALLFALMVSSPLAFGALKIGVVDMQKALESTKEGKAATKDLESDFGKRKQELEKREGELRKMGEDLDKKMAALSDQAKAKKQKQFQIEMQKFQQSVAKNQSDIQKRQNELLQPLVTKMRKIIAGIAEHENFTAIIERADQIVLYASQDIDLTDRVVKDFDSSSEK